jgi:catechol 2,3-dioxygenase-like lactoylglutathione lyase family enzyme
MNADQTGLSAYKLVAFVMISSPEHAKSFYRDKLGLKLVSEEPPFAMVFDVHGIMLRATLANKTVTPAPYTVLGWAVPDIGKAVSELQAAGVHCERFEWMKDQDERGIWTAPGGAKVAWFKDPDGNTLSVSEHPERGV